MGPSVYTIRQWPISVFNTIRRARGEIFGASAPEGPGIWIPVPAGAGSSPRQYYQAPPPLRGPRGRGWFRFGLCVFLALADPPSRWFRLPFSSWSPRVAVVSFILNVASRLALVLVTCGGFVLFVSLFGVSYWLASAKNWEVSVINHHRLNIATSIRSVDSGRASGRWFWMGPTDPL